LVSKYCLSRFVFLFGWKTDCDEFAPFGDLLQLEDVTDSNAKPKDKTRPTAFSGQRYG